MVSYTDQNDNSIQNLYLAYVPPAGGWREQDDLHAGAAVASIEGKGGFAFGGLAVTAAGGVDALSAHAGFGGSMIINDNTGTFRFKESADLGLGIGAKIHLDIQIPFRAIIKLISTL